MSSEDLAKIAALGLALAGKFAADALEWVITALTDDHRK